MDFENRLKRAIDRGEQTRNERDRKAQEQQLSAEELKNLHTQYRLELSEHIESCLQKLADHFPGFRYQSVVSEDGWGAKISRDDVNLNSSTDERNFFSRLELLVRPFSDTHIIELIGRGTIHNKKVYNRTHYQMLAQVDIDSFSELIDLWVLEYAERFASVK